MVICPLQNAADGSGDGQLRPHINQKFGENPQVYSQFNMKGHNGVDLHADMGTPVFAPFEGKVEVKNDNTIGYGLHVIVRKKMPDGTLKDSTLECVLGHLSETMVQTGDYVYIGQLIAKSGNTGFSTGPHLHFGLRYIDPTGTVKDYDNGFKGYFDPIDLILNWRGSLTKIEL